MIDTSGSFDPRNLIKKQPPGIGMQTSVPQTPVHSNGIPDVAPYQPIGNGILPTVPFGGQKSNLPSMGMNQSTPQTPIGMNQSASQTPNYTNPSQSVTEGNSAGLLMNPQVQPTAPQTQNYVEPQIQPQAPPQEESIDPRLRYGFNDNQWALNRSIEAQHDANEARGNGYIEGWGREQSLKNTPGYYSALGGLPDEAAWRAQRAKDLAPFNASVASERAAGRPGHSGEVPTTSNYVNPNIAPIASQVQPEIQPEVPQDDRWLGTQRRKPSYF